MKKFLNTFSVSLLIVLFFITGCQMHGNNNGVDDLLKTPPYASLTDSINQFPDNASLYLKRAALLTKNNQHEIAFHDFWPTVIENVRNGREQKIHFSKGIVDGQDNIVANCVEKMKRATAKAIKTLEGKLSNVGNLESFLPDLNGFFEACTRWNADMTLCETSLELIPKNCIPRKGTPINQLVGLPYEFDFEGNHSLCYTKPIITSSYHYLS